MTVAVIRDATWIVGGYCQALDNGWVRLRLTDRHDSLYTKWKLLALAKPAHAEVKECTLLRDNRRHRIFTELIYRDGWTHFSLWCSHYNFIFALFSPLIRPQKCAFISPFEGE